MECTVEGENTIDEFSWQIQEELLIFLRYTLPTFIPYLRKKEIPFCDLKSVDLKSIINVDVTNMMRNLRS